MKNLKLQEITIMYGKPLGRKSIVLDEALKAIPGGKKYVQCCYRQYGPQTGD